MELPYNVDCSILNVVSQQNAWYRFQNIEITSVRLFDTYNYFYWTLIYRRNVGFYLQPIYIFFLYKQQWFICHSNMDRLIHFEEIKNFVFDF